MAEKVDNSGQYHAAMLTCLHLSKVKKWGHVKLMHCSKLNTTFVHASKQHEGPVECILPILADEALSMNMLMNGLMYLCEEHPNSLVMALVENDGTIVYYSTYYGIHPPSLPNREARSKLTNTTACN